LLAFDKVKLILLAFSVFTWYALYKLGRQVGVGGRMIPTQSSDANGNKG